MKPEIIHLGIEVLVVRLPLSRYSATASQRRDGNCASVYHYRQRSIVSIEPPQREHDLVFEVRVVPDGKSDKMFDD